LGDIRFTIKSLKLLQTFASNPTKEYSGAEVMRATSMASGTIYPILIRFEQEGLLESYWEEVDPKQAGRPRRRLYRVTSRGAQTAREEFNKLVPDFAAGIAFNPMR
jgi:PadR family transcriptional regulator PadR